MSGSAPLDSEYTGNGLVAAAIVFIILEGVLVTMRFMSRSIAGTPWGLDDTLMIPALIFCWAICVHAGISKFESYLVVLPLTDSIVMVYVGGVGYHISYLAAMKPELLTPYFRTLVAIEEIYCISVVFPKLSILAMYLRILPKTPVYRNINYAMMFIVAATGFAGLVTSWASCRPLSLRWTQTTWEAPECINIDSFWRWISFPNIITDLVMLILPLPMVWTLKTSKMQKFSLTVLFLAASM
jgi:hypothetical protein